MITINGIRFSEYPSSCGTCPCFAFLSPSPLIRMGHCRMWNEMHHSYIDPPRRCRKLFKKVFEFPDGTDFELFENEKKED